MTDTAIATAPRRFGDNDALVAKRYRAERRFKAYGIVAIAVTAVFLVLLFADILSKGLPAFFENRMSLPVTVDAQAIDPQQGPQGHTHRRFRHAGARGFPRALS
jgi:phosphate transport system permease protein